jgi:hypothetical protein
MFASQIAHHRSHGLLVVGVAGVVGMFIHTSMQLLFVKCSESCRTASRSIRANVDDEGTTTWLPRLCMCCVVITVPGVACGWDVFLPRGGSGGGGGGGGGEEDVESRRLGFLIKTTAAGVLSQHLLPAPSSPLALSCLFTPSPCCLLFSSFFPGHGQGEALLCRQKASRNGAQLVQTPRRRSSCQTPWPTGDGSAG